MSDVSGTISVNLALTDSTALPTKTVLKSIAMTEDSEVSAGAVAIMSGTVGTTAVTLALDPTNYRNASGDFVSFGLSAPTRIALEASGTSAVRLLDVDLQQISLYSKNGIVAIGAWAGGSNPSSGMTVQTVAGTNDYTVIVMREE